MVRVTVEGGDSPNLGSPEELFQGQHFVSIGRQFDIAPDGSRFLMREGIDSAGSQLVMVLGFREELRRLVAGQME